MQTEMDKTFILSKTLEVSTGHRLHLHEGGCSNLHGHNYQIDIQISFRKGVSFIGGVGYYIDFSEVKNLINEYMDHQFLVNIKDPLGDLLKTLPGVRFVDYSPTAENIAIALERLIVNRFSNYESFKSVSISIKETSNSKISL